MVSQFTQQQQQAPPQAASPNLSPAQWAQLTQLVQSQQQSQYQPQAAPPSTSAYTSDGTMAAIDPNLLHAQWLQYQQSQLSQSAIIPQAVQAQYAPQYNQQYTNSPQPQGEFVSAESLASIAEFMQAANNAAIASRDYINLLESTMVEHRKLISFSAAQDDLIWRFLHDREFTLDYVRGAWTREGITDDFMSRLANVYLEIAELSPRGADPQYTGNPNPAFAVEPQTTPQPQNFIPPLPSSSGNANNGITMEQYLIAQQQGLVGAARAAAMQNPASLYASLFQ